jgi:Tol biopolymer transport system component
VFVVDRAAPSIVRVTANCTATDANGPSYSPIATPDGRLIAFESEASNLVAGDTNGLMDIFVADRATGAFELVSVGLGGAPANGPSSLGDATPDGRYIVFESYASNLVPGDTNGVPDIFVRDRTAGVTTRVSVAGDGSEANWYSMGGSLSADGQVVAFVSGATNLVPGDANRTYDVFVRDLAAGTTERVDAVATGTEPNDAAVTALLSADGRFVYFVSMASNLVPGDENEGIDVFSYDRTLGVVERLTELVYPGQETAWSGGVAFSDDGRYLALTGAPGSTVSSARGIVFDRVANGVTDIVAGEPPLSLDASVGPLSPDGSLVVVRGRNRFYVPDGRSDGGFAVFNRTTGTRTLVAESGYEGTFLENGEGLSLDSRFALMPGDTNELSDVYIAHRAPGVDPYAGPKCGR